MVTTVVTTIELTNIVVEAGQERTPEKFSGLKSRLDCSIDDYIYGDCPILNRIRRVYLLLFESQLQKNFTNRIENLDSTIGVYASDPEGFVTFADLLLPIIYDYHKGFTKDDNHPSTDYGDVNDFVNLDPEGKYVRSTRIRVARSLEGYPFTPCMTEDEFKAMQKQVGPVLNGLTGELAGDYYPIDKMIETVRESLIKSHFLFSEGDRFQQSGGMVEHWPTGRGVFHNVNKTFLVWCNQAEHFRIMSLQKGGDLGAVYRRLVMGMEAIVKHLKFVRTEHLGFLTAAIDCLGTGIRASVYIKLPKLGSDYKKLEELAASLNLQIRRALGDHKEYLNDIYDISNKRCLGLTEYAAVKEMQDGIIELIQVEKFLSGESEQVPNEGVLKIFANPQPT